MSPVLIVRLAGLNDRALLCTECTVPPLPPIAFKVEPVSYRSQPSVTIAFSMMVMSLPPVITPDVPQSSAQIPTAAGAVRPGVCVSVLSVMFISNPNADPNEFPQNKSPPQAKIVTPS